MEKLNELLREYAQSIRRDDGTGFMHADAIRELFRARAASANETADERAAFDSEVGNVIADAATRGIAWMAFKVGARYARAASANETGAEEAAEPYDEGDIERHFDDHGFYLHGFEEEDRANFFEAALALVAGRSPAMAADETGIRELDIGLLRDGIVTYALKRKLDVIRKTTSQRIQSLQLKHAKAYLVPSMSARTAVYKMLRPAAQVDVYHRAMQH
ncbi:hypothetical protein, partial [Burkholderia thailandensis]|uniref:hypothetical protein n=1 Tax=Burkholderia thailandensis TaxID=57975 RepID=UPI00217EA726